MEGTKSPPIILEVKLRRKKKLLKKYYSSGPISDTPIDGYSCQNGMPILRLSEFANSKSRISAKSDVPTGWIHWWAKPKPVHTCRISFGTAKIFFSDPAVVN
jgi:hypothetical protein